MSLTYEDNLDTMKQYFELPEAIAFFDENKYEIGLSPESSDLTARKVRCIDDRPFTDDRPMERNPIPLPGAGLGVLQSCYGGFLLLKEKYGLKEDIAPEKVAEAYESILGPATYHTDTAHENKEHDLECSGCGHCAGAFEHPDEYLQSPAVVKFLTEKYIPALKDKGINARVREGKHDAKAVFIIKPLHIGLQGWSEDGNTKAYVYHQGWHQAILNKLAVAMAKLVSPEAFGEGVDEEKKIELIKTAFWESAQIRLGHTVEHLAPEHPKFIVDEESGKVEITLA